MGKRTSEQAPLWVATTDLPRSPGHPFYAHLNTLLDAAGFDAFVEERARSFYAPVMGRPGLAPGRYFRLLRVGYFEGLDLQRGIAWRVADSLAVRSFVGLGLRRGSARSFDAFAHTAPDRRGGASGRLHVGAGAAGRRRAAQGENGGH